MASAPSTASATDVAQRTESACGAPSPARKLSVAIGSCATTSAPSSTSWRTIGNAGDSRTSSVSCLKASPRTAIRRPRTPPRPSRTSATVRAGCARLISSTASSSAHRHARAPSRGRPAPPRPSAGSSRRTRTRASKKEVIGAFSGAPSPARRRRSTASWCSAAHHLAVRRRRRARRTASASSLENEISVASTLFERVLDHLGGRAVRAHDRDARRSLVEPLEIVDRRVVLAAEHDPVRALEVADRDALGEELGVHPDAELRPGAAPGRRPRGRRTTVVRGVRARPCS